MRAGKLRHKITIQKNTPTASAYSSESVDSWAEFATIRADIRPLQGREYFDARQVNAEVNIKIIIRYLSGVVPTMRVLFGSRTFDIQDVINVDERNREMHLMCKERL